MSQSNTNTNNGHNRNSRRGGWGRGPPNGSGRGECRTNRRTNRGNKSIAKYSFKGKIKDGPISELTITETGHRPSQFKKIYNAILYFELRKTTVASMKSSVPDVTSSKMISWRLILTSTYGLIHTKYKPSPSNRGPPYLVEGTAKNERVVIYQTVEQRIVTNANLQKQLLSEYGRNSKNKSQEYNKFLRDKKIFNHYLIWTMWWSNPDSNCSWRQLYRRTQWRKAFSFYWATTRYMLWRQQRWPIICTLQTSCSNQVVEHIHQ